MAYEVRIPPMAEMVEDYGNPTQDLCPTCRQARVPRFNLLQEIVVQDATSKTPRESFVVCPYCDVEVSAR